MSEQTQRIQEIKARADAVSEYGHLSLSSDQNGEYYYIDRDSNHDYTNPMVETNSVDAARFILGAFIDIPWLLDQLEAAQQEQADPQPLTYEQLLIMDGTPVFNKKENSWHVIDNLDEIDELCMVIEFTDGTQIEFDPDDLHLYAHEPKGDRHDRLHK